MRWSRKKKAFLVVALVVLLFLGVDFCRVQISLSRIIDRAKLGATVDTTEAELGKASYQGTWSGSYGSGVMLVYRRPYVWEHVLPPLPTKISFWPFYVGFSYGWHNSPEVTIEFDERGRLAEVCKRGFASKRSVVTKSSRH